MPYASFHNNQPTRERSLTENGMTQGKAIAKIYGYMGIGLLITGLVAFLFAWLIHSQIASLLDDRGFLDPDRLDFAQGWLTATVAVWIVSAIAILILSFVIPIKARLSNKSVWVPFILYTVFMGLLLSAVLLAGIPFWMIGEAFGITALAFGSMFLIGWFSKKNLSILAFIAMGLMFGVLIAVLIGAITFAIRGGTADERFYFDIAIQGVMILVIMLITAFDTWRIKRIISRAGESSNIYLYAAFVMYTDFITLLLRVLAILARTQRR